ncbi:MAG: hypothetical protein WDO14_22030 [Bacteroidota bacterium]
MEDLRIIYRQLLRSDGVDQLQRLMTALKEEYVQLDDRSVAGYIRYLYQLSKEVRFLNPDLSYANTWEPLFARFLDGAATPTLVSDEKIEQISGDKNIEPALALLITFLELIQESKTSINKAIRKHLEFFYKNVLKFQILSGVADRVQLLFELNKNASPVSIVAGTLFEAGKGPDGNELRYATTSDIVVNRARVASIRSLFVEREKTNNTFQLWSEVHDVLPPTAILPPFGRPQSKQPPATRTMQYAVTGFVISSSLLELSGGERVIDIEMTSESFALDIVTFDDFRSYIQFELTGEKGWVTPLLRSVATDYVEVNNTRICTLKIQLALGEASPAIIPHSNAVHKTALPDGVPALRMITVPEKSVSEFFQAVRISSVSLKVSVKGLRKFVVQNEEGLQQPDKPFNLFGSIPAIGSRLYVGSNEVFSKNLKGLTINIKWKSPPANFNKYYAGYMLPSTFSHAEFSMSVDMLMNGSWDHTLSGRSSLFDAQNEDYPYTLALNETDLARANNFSALTRDQNVGDVSGGFRPGAGRGFIRFTLTGPKYDDFSAFGHSNFTSALMEATAAKIQFPAADIKLPQPAYTPQVKEISLDYVASDTIFPGTNDRVFHQTPFGIREVTTKGTSLFPQFAEVGYLHIGVSDLLLEQQVNLLLKLAETGLTKIESDSDDFAVPDVSWSYLANENWIDLRQDQIPVDTTKQFQQTGIVSLQTGADASINNNSFPAGMIWLRATLRQGTGRVLPLESIHTQVVEALLTLSNDEELSDYSIHLSAGLPPNSVKKNVRISPALKSILQPYASVGGVQPETSDHLIARVSERLRHRNRAIHTWDFERMVLNAFNEIAKAKCLTVRDELTQGTSTVIVVPKIRIDQPVSRRLQPKASSFFLDEIGTFFKARASAFTEVVVINPRYEEVLADFKVKFRVGYDPIYYLEKLNEEIVRFISPWAFGDQSDMHFDSIVYRSEVLYHIENLPYVDYVADFMLFHLNSLGDKSPKIIGKMKVGRTFVVARTPMPNLGGMQIGENFIVGLDMEVIEPSRDEAMLVSVPKHAIKTTDDQRTCSGVSGLGIGSMTINFDFIVSRS